MADDVKREINESSDSPFNELTRSIFEGSFDLFGVLDSEGRVIEMHGGIFERAGTKPEKLAGQQFTQTVYWQSSEDIAGLIEEAIDNCLRGACEKLRLQFRLNAEKRVLIEISLVRFPYGGDFRIFISGRTDLENADVSTDIHRSEHLFTAAENADIGLWYWDLIEQRTYSTPRCNEIFGVPAFEELNFDRFIAAVHPEDQKFVSEFFDISLKDGRVFDEEFRVKYKDGTVEWIRAEGKSVLGPDKVPLKMMGAVHKITEEKLAVENLARANELEKRARDEAIEANRTKDFFLAFVSHEIRSSLNVITGWSRILLRRDLDAKTSHDALEKIVQSAENQTKLINDLVDSARVASGKLRLEYRLVDISDLVRREFEAHQPAAESNSVEYTFSSDLESLTILADPARLSQVFGNLISNALKFTPSGGKISVSLTTGAEAVTIDVADTGAGIAADALPNVFRQFSQVENGNFGGNSGLGLGLSIVKILVERHGGHVRAESHGIGKGAKFSVTLPINTDEVVFIDSNPRIDMRTSRPLEGLKILIVEDNVDSREVLQMFLEKSGAKVIPAESAKAAFKILTGSIGRRPNLLISDLAMPDEDGYSLITRIRQLSPEEGGTIPAVALSAFANEESRRKAFDSGFQRYATKPFDHDTLITDIFKAIAKEDPRGEKQG